MRRDVFQAIADPTRREIIDVIAQKPIPLSAVAESFDISRQAVSKHVQILRECGLLQVRREGREHYCEANLRKLNEVSQWIERYRRHWEARLDALEQYIAVVQTKNKHHGKSK